MLASLLVRSRNAYSHVITNSLGVVVTVGVAVAIAVAFAGVLVIAVARGSSRRYLHWKNRYPSKPQKPPILNFLIISVQYPRTWDFH